MSCIRMAKALSPGSLLAVKVVEFATGDVAKTTLRELEMLKDFNHPNIVTFFGMSMNGLFAGILSSSYDECSACVYVLGNHFNRF